MTFIVAKKETPRGLLLAVTDKAVFGKVFTQGNVQLDLAKSFYQGVEMEKEEVQKLLAEARYLHLTGKEAVQLGVELGLVDEQSVLYVQKVPHAEGVME
ncbi:MAG TPA: DUF424 family protein [Candidatus Nanoarchaeia archaeon]|nr:DUF424 family protein [Candidatus Nanoarchaeia archaeon]